MVDAHLYEAGGLLCPTVVGSGCTGVSDAHRSQKRSNYYDDGDLCKEDHVAPGSTLMGWPGTLAASRQGLPKSLKLPPAQASDRPGKESGAATPFATGLTTWISACCSKSLESSGRSKISPAARGLG
jgi:hypothetical protein